MAAPEPIARLSQAERSELFEDLDYLNQAELRRVCRRYEIPYRIQLTLSDGGVRAAGDDDRKGVILDRLRRVLQTGERVPATVLSASVVGPERRASHPTAGDPVHYRAYDRGNAPVLELLGRLTDGAFHDGARARVLLMAHWTAGRAPTFAQFAAEWLASERRGDSLVAPEYAYLTDLRAGRAGADWKQLRRRRAQRALATLGFDRE